MENLEGYETLITASLTVMFWVTVRILIFWNEQQKEFDKKNINNEKG